MAESKLHIRAARGNLNQAHDILIGVGKPKDPDEVTKGDLAQALTFARVAANQIVQAQFARGLEQDA